MLIVCEWMFMDWENEIRENKNILSIFFCGEWIVCGNGGSF